MKFLITVVLSLVLLFAQSCINEPSKKGNDDTVADDGSVVLTLNISLSNVEVDEIVVGLLNDGTSFESTSEAIAEGSEAAKLTFMVPMGEAITINYTCFYKNDLVARNSKTVTLQSDSTIESIPDVKALVFFTGNDTTIFINEQYTVDVLWEDDSDSYELLYQFGADEDFVSTPQYRFDELGSYIVVTQALDGINELFDTVSVTVIDYSEALPNESSNEGIELSTDSESSSVVLSSSIVESSTVSSSLSSDGVSSSSHVSSSSVVSSSELSSSSQSSSSIIELSSSSTVHHSITIATEDSDKLSVDITEYSVPDGELTVVPVTVTGVNGGTLDEWSVEGDCEVSGGTSLELTCTGAGTVTALYTRKLVSSITITGSDEIRLATVGIDYQFNHSVLPLDVDNSSVVWSSENSRVATIDAKGLLTTKGVGSVNIIVTAQDGSGVSEMVVVHVIQNSAVYSEKGTNVLDATALSGGGFVIANQAYASSSNSWGEFSIFSNEGNALSSPIEFRGEEIREVSVGDLGNERFVIVSWLMKFENGSAIYNTNYSIYTTQGSAIVDNRTITTASSVGGMEDIKVLPMGSGEFIIMYSGRIGSPYPVGYLGMLRFNSDGNQIGNEVVISNSYNIYDAAVLTNGNIVILHGKSHSSQNPQQYDGYYTVISSKGIILKSDVLIQERIYGGSVATLSNNTFVLSYSDYDNNARGLLNFYSNDGSPLHTQVVFNADNYGTSYHDVTDLGNGYCMVAYSHGYGNSGDVGTMQYGYYGKFAYDGTKFSFGMYGSKLSYAATKSYANKALSLTNGVTAIAYGTDTGASFTVTNLENYNK